MSPVKAALWQHPYVDVFKEFGAHAEREKRRCVYVGDVSRVLDPAVGKMVLVISGTVAASNHVEIAGARGAGGLGLTGRFCAVQYRPAPRRYYFIHVDVALRGGLALRLSFSNMYKDVKARERDVQIPLPGDPRWSLLVVDLPRALEAASGGRHSASDYVAVRGLELGAALAVHGVWTSDAPLLGADAAPEMSWPVPVGRDWSDVYALNVFPRASPLDGAGGRAPEYAPTGAGAADWGLEARAAPPARPDPDARVEPRAATRASGRGARTPPPPAAGGGIWPAAAAPDPGASLRSQPLPAGLLHAGSGARLDAVAASAESPVRPARSMEAPRSGGASARTGALGGAGGASPADQAHLARLRAAVDARAEDLLGRARGAAAPGSPPHPYELAAAAPRGGRGAADAAPDVAGDEGPLLSPDPIMRLAQVVGVNGSAPNVLLWDVDGRELVFACSCVVVAMSPRPAATDAASGRRQGALAQRHFLGHTAAVSCLALSRGGLLLASGQEGAHPAIRLWNFGTGAPLAVLGAHASALGSISFSDDDTMLAAHGRDSHGRVLVVVWDVRGAATPGRQAALPVVAKQLSDFPISRLKFSPFEAHRLVSCGRENIRFWRMKRGCLPGCPVVLNAFARGSHFTDVAFDAAYGARDQDTAVQRRIYVSASSGSVVLVNYDSLQVECIVRLHSAAIHSIAVNEGFCVTASDDCFLRVWPLDFSDYFLEAKHEGPVTSAAVSPDGILVGVVAANGTVGLLDVSTHAYNTLQRGHTGDVFAVAVRPRPPPGAPPQYDEVATVSSDGMVRVWDAATWEQLYEFTAPGEVSRCVAYHPTEHVIACGFDNGCVRVFNVPATAMLHEYQQHKGPVRVVAFMPDGALLFSAGEDGHVCVYNTAQAYTPSKMLAADVGPAAHATSVCLAVNAQGTLLAVAFSTDPGGAPAPPREAAAAAAASARFAGTSSGEQANCVVLLEPRSLTPRRKLLLPPVPVRGSGGRAPRVEAGALGDTAAAAAHAIAAVLVPDASAPAAPVAAGASDILSLVFTPDGRYAVATTADARCVRWDAASGAVVKEVRGLHRGPVHALALSHDGRYMATGGDDRVIKLWDGLMRGPPPPVPQSFVGHAGAVESVVFLPGGAQFVSAGATGALYSWEFFGEGGGGGGGGGGGYLGDSAAASDGARASGVGSDGGFSGDSDGRGRDTGDERGVAEEGPRANEAASAAGAAVPAVRADSTPSRVASSPIAMDIASSAAPAAAATPMLHHSMATRDLHTPALERAEGGDGSDGDGDGSAGEGSYVGDDEDLARDAEFALAGDVASEPMGDCALARVMTVGVQAGDTGVGGVVWCARTGLFGYAVHDSVVLERPPARQQTVLEGVPNMRVCAVDVSPSGGVIAFAGRPAPGGAGPADSGALGIGVWTSEGDGGAAAAAGDAGAWRQLCSLQYHKRPVVALAISPGGRYLVSVDEAGAGGGGAACDLVVWDIIDLKVCASVGLPEAVAAVAWCPPPCAPAVERAGRVEGLMGFASAGTGSVSEWSFGPLLGHLTARPLTGVSAVGVRAGGVGGAVRPPDAPFTCVVTSAAPDGGGARGIAAGDAAGRLRLWVGERLVLDWRARWSGRGGADAGFVALNWVDGGRAVIGADAAGRIVAWDATGAWAAVGAGGSVAELPLLHEHLVDARVSSLRFDARGGDGIALSASGSVWYVKWGSPPTRLASGHTAPVAALCSTAALAGAHGDGGAAASDAPAHVIVSAGGADGSVRVWSSISFDQVCVSVWVAMCASAGVGGRTAARVCVGGTIPAGLAADGDVSCGSSDEWQGPAARGGGLQRRQRAHVQAR